MSDVEWCQNCGDVVTDDGCACAAIPKPTGVLTREQVEEVFNAVYWHGDQQGAKQCKVLDGIDALRATITQQAQELEQAKGNYAIQKAAADDYEQQLAAMTRERDAFKDSRDAIVETAQGLRKQLAASQAKVKELEAQWHYAATHDADMDYVKEIAQLQATLAAREARVAELEGHP